MNETPAIKWRRMIREGGMRAYQPAAGADVETDFRRFLERELDRSLRELSTNTEAARVALFVLAVALLTYGRLDMVELILSNAPPPDTHLSAFSSALRELLPLPKEIDPRHVQHVRDWLAEHRQTLRWNDDAGRFEEALAP